MMPPTNTVFTHFWSATNAYAGTYLNLPAPNPINVVNIASKSGNFVNENENPPPGAFAPGPPPGGLYGKFNASVPSCTS